MEKNLDLELQDNQLVKHCSYIDGHWHRSEFQISVTNPASGKVITQVGDAGVVEIELAIKAAKKAFKMWSSKSANERATLMRNWFHLMMIHQDDLAKILTLEQGKPLAEAKGEIAYGAAFIDWFAEEGKRVYGDTIPAPSSDKRIIVIKQPIGVVASITPWNFPSAMIARKAAAALSTGCTFVVRPATQTPLSALAMAELAERAGIPAGVFNVVVGKDARGMGKILTQHPDIAKFTFTGSTPMGKVLLAQCATSVKKCRWSWEGMRHLSFLTTLISMLRYKALWFQNIVMQVKHVCAPTVFLCNVVLLKSLLKNSPRRLLSW